MTDQPQQPTEEQIRAYEAQLEEQMAQLRVEDVIVQTIVTLVNLGGRRAGLAPGTEGERDPGQLKLAVDGARALVPLLEEQLGPDAAAIRDALSQLQMAYVQLTGASPAPGGPVSGDAAAPSNDPTGPGPAQPPSRLWIPGQ